MSVTRIAAGVWRDAVAARLADGARFAGAWAAGGEWRVALAGPDGATAVLGCEAVDGVVPTIVDLVPAEDFAAVGRVFDRVSDHLVTRHPESEIRQS